MSNTESPTLDEKELSPTKKGIFQFWRCFWLLFLVISLGYAWYCFYAPSNAIAWEADYDSAQRSASVSDKPILMYFTGSWCVPCRIMKRQVWADEQVTSLVNDNYVPVAIDIDNPAEQDIIARYKIQSTPVTIVADADGNVLDWRAGGISKDQFMDFINSVGNPTEESLESTTN